jgi:phenylpropionate dioxygenase-like ring-hydroxylating dioxygenase large terminal subunit
MQRPLPREAFLQADTYAATRLPVDHATSLIPDAYTSHDFHALEQERLFTRTWVPVCLGSDIAGPGDYTVVEVAGRSIIVCRNGSGELRAHHNVCRHRGARLCDGAGKTERLLHCPYHGWAYDLDGNCRATPHFVPGMLASDARFDRSEMGLHPVRVAQWAFLVFVCLDPSAPRLEEALGDLPARLSGYPLEQFRVTRRREYTIAANWKLVAENFVEYYHLPLIHPALLPVSPVEAHYRWQGRGKYAGLCTWPVGSDTADGGWKGLPPAPGVQGRDAESARFAWIFPTAGISVTANHVFVLIARPEGPERSSESAFILTHPDSEAASPDAEADIDTLIGFWDTINREDIAIVERTQCGLRNPAYTGGRMCHRFEEPCHRLQNMVIDAMLGIECTPAGDDAETARRLGPPYGAT